MRVLLVLAGLLLVAGCADPSLERQRDAVFAETLNGARSTSGVDPALIAFGRDQCHAIEMGQGSWWSASLDATNIEGWSPQQARAVLRAAHTAYCPGVPAPPR